MKMQDRERVDGTNVSIGRRVQARAGHPGMPKSNVVSATYTAIYIDVDGQRREQGLGTTNKREARRKAIEIAQRLEQGKGREVVKRLTSTDLITQYIDYINAADLADKSRAKYLADLSKLSEFVVEERIVYADQFDEHRFSKFRVWLQSKKHKQGLTYSSKSIYAAMTITKQAFKWAWQRKLMRDYPLASAKLPRAKPKPQPCFTTEQVESVLTRLEGDVHAAIAILAYSGMRVGELLQLTWKDVRLSEDRLGMFHIHTGGSRGTTKDKEERFVPIHPRIRPVLEALPRRSDLVLPDVRDRRLLTQLKAACVAAKLPNAKAFKVHSLRHHFASVVANHNVSYRKALAWLGHSDSEMLSNYYHLHDDEAEQSMRALANATADHAPRTRVFSQQTNDPFNHPRENAPGDVITSKSLNSKNSEESASTKSFSVTHTAQKGSQRGTRHAKTMTPHSQTTEITVDANGGSIEAERGGFEPPVQTLIRTTV